MLVLAQVSSTKTRRAGFRPSLELFPLLAPSGDLRAELFGGENARNGATTDFYLSVTRNAKAAKRLLGKALNGLKDWEKPGAINADKASTCGVAIAAFKAEGKLPEAVLHRRLNYLNTMTEADHGRLKQLIEPVRIFKSLTTAYATIDGFEAIAAVCNSVERATAPPRSDRRSNLEATWLYRIAHGSAGRNSCDAIPANAGPAEPWLPRRDQK